MITVSFSEQEVKYLMHIVLNYEAKKYELDDVGWSQEARALCRKLNAALIVQMKSSL
jgi:hypothetical protein